jgi:hypothetical protein
MPWFVGPYLIAVDAAFFMPDTRRDQLPHGDASQEIG